MFRKELLIVCSVGATVFLLVAVASSLVGRAIQREASMIAVDTLPSLVDAGAAMTLTEENWLRVQLLVHAASEAARAANVQEIRTNSNEGLWREYGESVFAEEDRKNYNELLVLRTNFLTLREEFLALTQAGRLPEAQSFLELKLTPAYQRYKANSRKLFEYNARHGRERAAKVIRFSRVAPLALAGFCVLIFAFGVVVGLRGAFTGLELASRFRKQ
jgi:hypothetical protein